MGYHLMIQWFPHGSMSRSCSRIRIGLRFRSRFQIYCSTRSPPASEKVNINRTGLEDVSPVPAAAGVLAVGWSFRSLVTGASARLVLHPNATYVSPVLVLPRCSSCLQRNPLHPAQRGIKVL